MKSKKNPLENGGRPGGLFKTPQGSTVHIGGKHNGTFTISFDWAEERACCDCRPEYNFRGHTLEWTCEECPGGSAELT